MFKRGRSLFERLTGSVSFHEEEKDEALITSDSSQANFLKQREMENTPEEAELAVDVYQTPTEIIIKTMVAGVRPDDLNIVITREMVTIKGRREEAREIEDDDYVQRELYWGAFAKTIVLPAEVEAEEAEATERNGLLTLRLPKIDKNRTQKLKVKSV